jgi:hypothetical protein
MFSVFLTVFSVTLKYIFLLVSYVSNTNSFPQPLSTEEEQMYDVISISFSSTSASKTSVRTLLLSQRTPPEILLLLHT